jgi:hypothetical protein
MGRRKNAKKKDRKNPLVKSGSRNQKKKEAKNKARNSHA